MISAVTLADYGNNEPLVTDAVTELGFGAANNICEVEAMLSKNHFAKPYVNTATDFSIHFFTFPTRHTFSAKKEYDLLDPDSDDYCTCVTGKGPFWYLRNRDNGSGKGNGNNEAYLPSQDEKPYCAVKYTATVWDMEENKPDVPEEGFSGGEEAPPDTFPDEMNFLFSTGFPYPEGWVDYEMLPGKAYHHHWGGGDHLGGKWTYCLNLDNEPLWFDGVPVIDPVLHFRNGAFSMAYGSWEWGEVLYSPTPYAGSPCNHVEHYQVADMFGFNPCADTHATPSFGPKLPHVPFWPGDFQLVE
jgi:hypothetical protein